jgi:GAF domain-containing protein
MKKAPQHESEGDRLDALHKRGLLDNKNDPRFVALLKEASEKLKIPITTVSLLDKDKEVYAACLGIEQTEGPREVSFCGHALVDTQVLVCEDTLEDERFSDNPYVIGPPYIRFYAGMKLLDKNSGLPIAVFCVKDTKPRKMNLNELGEFMGFADRAQDILDRI